MVNFMLVFKGMLVGLAKIIPGVSGSLLAVSLGIYTLALEAISHPFKNLKENVIFLGNVGFGVVISISLCSGLISFFLNRYYFITVLLFIGFIVGTFPQLFKQSNISNKWDWLFVILISISIYFFSSFRISNVFIYENTFLCNLLVFIFGFIDAATMVIPGISGTAIFLLIGCYPFILNLFSSIPTFFYNTNFLIYILFFGGLFSGILIVSNIMNYVLKHYEKKTYLFIVSFAFSSILLLFGELFSNSFNFIDLFIGIILFFVGYKISSKLNI